jgi:hypothetical protein
MILPTLTPTVNGSKIDAVLAHMDDCHPDDATTARMWLSANIRGTYTYAHQDIADALTQYARDNNLGTGVSEASVRRYRKARR